MSCIFYECSSLLSIPDISKWNTSNIINMNYLFGKCKNIENIPDISNQNTSNVKYMQGIFMECKSLKSLPDISKWDTSNIKFMGGIFTNLSSLFSISMKKAIKYKEEGKAYIINGIFCVCSSLKSLPDISKWNTNNVTDMSYMFFKCSSLSSVFDFSKIYETKSLTFLPGNSKIFIKTINGKTIFVYYLYDDTIENIKNKIKIKENIPTELQLLFFNDQQLEDSKTLRDYNILKFYHLEVVVH